MQLTLNIEDKNLKNFLFEESKSMGLSINEFILHILRKEMKIVEKSKIDNLKA